MGQKRPTNLIGYSAVVKRRDSAVLIRTVWGEGLVD